MVRSLLVGMGATGLLASGVALADNHDHGHKVNFEFRGALTSADNGWSGDDAEGSLGLGAERAKINFSGDLDKGVSYRFRLNVASDMYPHTVSTDDDGAVTGVSHGAHMVEYGYLKADLGMFKVLVGKSKVKQGGWDIRNNGTWVLNSNLRDPHTVGALGFESYASMTSLHFDVAGELSVQLLNDTDADGKAGLTYNLEWLGNAMGGITPLFQYGAYQGGDNTHMDIGANYKAGAISVAFDYYTHTVKDTSTATNISVGAEYGMGAYTPFFHYDAFNVEEEVEGDAEAPDFNNLLLGGLTHDNVTRMTIGTWVNRWGDHFRPFVAVYMNSAKFGTSAEDAEDRSSQDIKIGVAGQW